jgi:phosphoglycolate phosphatase-like HAD superfamily hydrolase
MKINTVILDIDNTLVHSVSRWIVKNEWKDKFEWFDSGSHIVFLRPGVRDFISNLFDKGYNVGLYTAGSKDYADEIVKELFKGRELKFVFTSSDFNIYDKEGQNKPLKYITDKYSDLGECIIIDDANKVKRYNGDRCYQIKLFCVCYYDVPVFYEESVNDTELVKCMEWLTNKK